MMNGLNCQLLASPFQILRFAIAAAASVITRGVKRSPFSAMKRPRFSHHALESFRTSFWNLMKPMNLGIEVQHSESPGESLVNGCLVRNLVIFHSRIASVGHVLSKFGHETFLNYHGPGSKRGPWIIPHQRRSQLPQPVQPLWRRAHGFTMNNSCPWWAIISWSRLQTTSNIR